MGNYKYQRFGDEKDDTITFLHAQIQKNVGHPVGIPLQFKIGDFCLFLAIFKKVIAGFSLWAMKEAVKQENYELASDLRDQIRRMEADESADSGEPPDDAG